VPLPCAFIAGALDLPAWAPPVVVLASVLRAPVRVERLPHHLARALLGQAPSRREPRAGAVRHDFTSVR
jgi:hypothetical protein